MVRLILAVVVAIFVGAVLRLAWLRLRGNPRAFLLTFGAAALVLLLLAGLATGRLHWLFSIPAALLPFAGRIARFLPLLRILRGLRGGPAPLGGGPGSGTDGRSRVETAHLCMTLDHGTGELDGEILAGPEAGRHLSELDEARLVELLRRWRGEDADAARLLETYLDRTRGSAWRGGAEGSGADDGGAVPPSGELSRADALAILGLEGEPDRDEILRAHRRLMQQFHPDHGGSDYLAALLNRARARLVDELG